MRWMCHPISRIWLPMSLLEQHSVVATNKADGFLNSRVNKLFAASSILALSSFQDRGIESIYSQTKICMCNKKCNNSSFTLSICFWSSSFSFPHSPNRITCLISLMTAGYYEYIMMCFICNCLYMPIETSLSR